MKYKLILTDFNMPVMDGIKSTFKIRNFLSSEMNLKFDDQPMIVGITGHVHDQFRKEGIEAGMDEIILKPCYLSTMKDLL